MLPFLPDVTVDPPSPEPRDAYEVSAEFYDILQADRDRARVHRFYARDVRTARGGVLDVGAGTGRVTLMSLAESRVPVHAVEPTRSMRSLLMTRLAALPADMRTRVTVHPQGLGEAGLREVADVAICHNTIGCLPPDARRALWPAVAGALVPGGVLLVHLPPDRLPRDEVTHVLPAQKVGQHVYGGRMVMSADADRIRTRFDYWVGGARGVLREYTETFWMWPASRTEVIAELAGSGFVPLPRRADPAVLAVRLAR
ncbi:class I SAM-dependent methyltransferase [Streptomyces sp. HUAS 31]|uniref:class I SAM-dependent methyltransferase n=1 Tax=Streptomyces TaxID=1883 RepID=UPI002305A74D|nr:class I SAM-dependent methyltransferase [Streptomyces sp. HUAS 31]WCE01143.1 class I SAM-dependent methyltransferase [Streptomyces sp. HUAS 31]